MNEVITPDLTENKSAAFDVMQIMSDLKPENQVKFMSFILNQNTTSSEALDKKEEEMPTHKKIKGVRQRTDGRWEGRYMLDGKHISVYAHTQRECKKKLDKARKDLKSNKSLSQIKSLKNLNEWFMTWLKTFKAGIKEQSKLEISTRYHNYIKPTLGNRKLKSISVTELQSCLNEVPYESVKKRLYRELRGIFNKALIADLITKDPMLGVDDKSKTNSVQTTVLSQQQHKDFLELLSNDNLELKYIIEFASYSGLRLGEICALEVSDIDFEKRYLDISDGVINVTKSMNKKTNMIGPPKTDKSVREVPLLEPARRCIQEYIKLYKPKKRLFYNYTSANLSNAVRRYAKKYGLEGISMQSFRQYFISLCATLHIELKVRQKWAGHTDERLTHKVYTRVQPALERESIETFNGYTI